VVGAGIVGLSIAYQLARHRAGRVSVLEKGPEVAEGSTGASSAVLRQRYSHDEVVRLARDGVAAYRSWPESRAPASSTSGCSG
jgi:glycine/D-amino acid oxidase-like deaminating enzyme